MKVLQQPQDGERAQHRYNAVISLSQGAVLTLVPGVIMPGVGIRRDNGSVTLTAAVSSNCITPRTLSHCCQG